jgi:hypothetical protein
VQGQTRQEGGAHVGTDQLHVAPTARSAASKPFPATRTFAWLAGPCGGLTFVGGGTPTTGFVLDNDTVWGRPAGVAVTRDGAVESAVETLAKPR